MKRLLAKIFNRLCKPLGFQMVAAGHLTQCENREDFSILPGWKEVFPKLRDVEFYKPHFEPWRGYGKFGPLFESMRPYTLVPQQKCFVLYELARQALNLPGEFAECGVYRGGTAILLNSVLGNQSAESFKRLHLFDTFQGMPPPDSDKDLHKAGDFADTSAAEVQKKLPFPALADFHVGFVPNTFRELENLKFALCHIDMDIYRAIYDACEFLYPRLSRGGLMVFDDYAVYTCPGARQAVDDFFADKIEKPIVLPCYQTIVIKL